MNTQGQILNSYKGKVMSVQNTLTDYNIVNVEVMINKDKKYLDKNLLGKEVSVQFYSEFKN